MNKRFYLTKTSPIVETPNGKLRGYHYDGVDHFLGIRYAKAKRFQMPEPVKPWEGIKTADCYGYTCPLLAEPALLGEVQTPHRFWPSSEHCQYLNIWTTACDKNAKKPVMIWIHGGGFSEGSAIEQEAYDGFHLAKLDDVVVVSVNHRLNAFGFLDLSDFGEKYKNSVNAGMADLVEALRWVRDNIRCFGGDPENVTVFGQSCGGGKVTILGQIPEAAGLFHKAIIMSGVIPAEDFESDCEPKEFVLSILEQLHIAEADIEKLEKVPVPQFVWAVNRATQAFQKQGMRINWIPKPNNYYLCDPLVGDFSQHALSVPTIVGTVFAEFGFMTKDYGERSELSKEQQVAYVKEYYGEEGAQKILAAYKKAYPHMDEIYAVDLETMFLAPTVEFIEKKTKKKSAPVYNYMFAKMFDYDGGRAAWHCSDVPFFFHNAENIPICHQPNYQTLNRVMSGAFVNFARTGDPNVEGLPRWEKCEDGRMVTMVFGDECYTRENMFNELLPLLQTYKPPFQIDIVLENEDDEEMGEVEDAWVF